MDGQNIGHPSKLVHVLPLLPCPDRVGLEGLGEEVVQGPPRIQGDLHASVTFTSKGGARGDATEQCPCVNMALHTMTSDRG